METVRAELMSDPDVQAAYEAEERKMRLQAMLASPCRAYSGAGG